tara:strand:+ start:211 stop:549 length:339 start_codon:yes stop_codon:yes gene_type:complete
MKFKIQSILKKIRKLYYTTTEEALELASKEPGIIGKLFMAIYFPSTGKNPCKKEFLQRMLNRIILIASTMGGMFILSKYLEIRFFEGVFLILALTSLFPYVGYLVAKKTLES